MRRLLVALALAGLLAGLPGAAAAGPGDARTPRGSKRVTLDRVEVEPSRLGLLRVRLFVNAIDLDTIGSVITVGGADAWKIAGSAAIKKFPYLTGVYAGADAETAIVLI